MSDSMQISHVRLYAAPWTVACQAPLSMGFPQARILDWIARSTPPGDLPDPEIKPVSLGLLHWQVGSLLPAAPRKPHLAPSH